MNDSISRQDAIDALCKVGCGSGHCGISCDDVKVIEALPTAEKVGNWIEVKNRWDGLEIRCSECGAQVPRDEWGNEMQCAYCPWCGARMVRGDEMTSKEAAELIRRYVINDGTKWDNAMFLAYQALQKQIPKKPLQACGHATEMFRESIPSMNYCPICGQRIDWKGEEDENNN